MAVKAKFKDVLRGAERLINAFLRKEIVDQGHSLTGDLESSFTSKVSDAELEGLAYNYSKFVNEGFKEASFKQFPFLVAYFKKRGESDKNAKAYAAMTINKWKKQGGMPTQASKRFSKTGSRLNFIENSFEGKESELNEYMINGLDFVVNENLLDFKTGEI